MNPRAIKVHIEELTLHGVEARERWAIGDALQGELTRLLSEKGLPAGWANNPGRIDAGPVRLTSGAANGRAIAAAIHSGGNAR